MKKVFLALSLMLFVGTVATAASSDVQGVKTEKNEKKKDKKKKKKKSGCCEAKPAGAATGTGSCCSKKQD